MSAARQGARPLGELARRRLRANPVARSLHRAVLSSVDGVENALARRDPLQPPRRLRGVGAGDFRDVGLAIVQQLAAPGGLRPTDRVLDIGCGSGRVAAPLTEHLRGGSYVGFDIDPEMIGWCRRTISPRFPNFAFDVLDIANTHYNPRGAVAATAVRFPYENGRFDFALATSLFTHMLPDAFANYVAETARVLAPGGTLFATFFLVDDDARVRIGRGEAKIDLRHRLVDDDGHAYHVMNPRTPETALGFELGFVAETLQAAGLTVVDEVYPGTWSGRSAGVSYQDVLVARRC